MSNVSEIIRQQAAAVKTGSNNEKVAALILQAAKILQGGSQTELAAFATQTKARTSEKKNISKAGLEKFLNSLGQFDKEQAAAPYNKAHQALMQAKWTRTGHNPATNTASYKHDQKPGEQITLKDNAFTHTKDGKPLKEKTPLEQLPAHLQKK